MRISLKGKTYIAAFSFCLLSMGLVLYMGAHKAIVLEGNGPGHGSPGQAYFAAGQEDGTVPLHFLQSGSDTGITLRIPIESGVTAEQITVTENHDVSRQLWVMTDCKEEDFYKEAVISGNLEGISGGNIRVEGQKAILCFQLDGVYECKSTLEGQQLHIELVSPRQVYERIVALDVMQGQEQTEIAELIAEKTEELLTEEGVGVYRTFVDGAELSPKEQQSYLEELSPDMLIGIRLADSGDTGLYGVEAVYNGAYYLPELSNVRLADLLVKNVVSCINNRGNGLYETEKSDILFNSVEIPAAAVYVGYSSNEKEAALLERADYRDFIACGICRAVMEAYEERER